MRRPLPAWAWDWLNPGLSSRSTWWQAPQADGDFGEVTQILFPQGAQVACHGGQQFQVDGLDGYALEPHGIDAGLCQVLVVRQHQAGEGFDIQGRHFLAGQADLRQAQAFVGVAVRQHQARNDFMLDGLGQQGQSQVHGVAVRLAVVIR